MTVFFSILKIIGIVILSILALLLLLIAMVLFVPVRYELNAKKDDEVVDAKGYVSWLCHIVHLGFYYEDKTVPYIFRIFGVPIKKGFFLGEGKSSDTEDTVKPNKKHVQKTKCEKNKTDLKEALPVNDNKEINVPPPGIDIKDTIENTAVNTNTVCSESTTSIKRITCTEGDTEGDAEGITEGVLEGGNESFGDKIASFFKSIYDKAIALIKAVKVFFENIDSGIEKVKKEFDFYQRFLEDEHNKAAMELAFKEVKRVLKAVLPVRVAGDIEFGFDDPATTGQILVFLSILYPRIPRKLSVHPDFENVLFEGNIKVKGRIFLIVLLIAGWKVYFSKDIKRFLHIYKKHKNKAA